MRRFALLALIAAVALSAGMITAPDASARGCNQSITQIGDCSGCSPFLLDGNTVCKLESCRELPITDPYGNPYVQCRYKCKCGGLELG